MSIYQGKWPENTTLTSVQVMVDDHPLPIRSDYAMSTERSFGWGAFGPWANKKLLAFSMLLYELSINMGLPTTKAYQQAVALSDMFLEEQVSKLDKQWSMTSENIQQWIKAKSSYGSQWRGH